MVVVSAIGRQPTEPVERDIQRGCKSHGDGQGGEGGSGLIFDQRGTANAQLVRERGLGQLSTQASRPETFPEFFRKQVGCGG